MTVSRHKADCVGRKVRWLPFPPLGSPGPDLEYVLDKPFITVGHCPDIQSDVVVINSLRIPESAGEAAAHTLRGPLSLHTHHHARITELAVGSTGGEVVVVVGGSDGRLTRLRVTAPQASGIATDHVQVSCLASGGGPPRSGRQLAPWTPQPVHLGGACRALHINQDTLDVVSAGEDGSVVVLNAAQQSSGSTPGHSVVAPAAVEREGIRAVCWASQHTFLVAGDGGGGVQQWDPRHSSHHHHPPKLNHHPKINTDPIQCMSVLRSRPHICASGSESGTVSLWDLRNLSEVMGSCSLASSSPVWEVHFDSLNHFTPASLLSDGGLPGVVACNENGELILTAGLETSAPSNVTLYQDLTGINSFHVDPSACQDIICCTDTEEYIHLYESASQSRSSLIVG